MKKMQLYEISEAKAIKYHHSKPKTITAFHFDVNPSVHVKKREMAKKINKDSQMQESQFMPTVVKETATVRQDYDYEEFQIPTI